MNRTAGRLLALPTLLLVLAFVVQATRTLEGGQETGALAASELTAADRVVVYELTRAGGPRFRLPGGPEQIHLFVHLELPRALTSAAPRGLFRFGVTATLRGPDGAALWERTVTQRTRQADDEHELGQGELAAIASRVTLSESGSLEISVPAAPVGAVLELRLADAAGLLADDGARVLAPITGPTALVRAYRRIAVDPAQAELRRLALAADAGARRLAAATYLPWYALPEQQQRQRLTIAWERLAAEGRAGVDYEVRSLYLAPPKPAVAPVPAEPALTIGPGQPVVQQLIGPGALELRAWPIAQPPGDGAPALELRLRRLSPTPTLAGLATARSGQPVPEDSKDRPVPEDTSKPVEETVRIVTLEPGRLVREPITIGPGWWSLELHSERAEIAAQVRADVAERHAGPEDHAQHHDHAGQAFVPVDLRLLPLYLQGPGQAPLPIALQPGGDVDARLIQIDVRALGELAPVAVRYSFVDAAGLELAAGASTAETRVPAPFERLRQPSAVAEDVAEDSSEDPLASLRPAPVQPPPGAGAPNLALGFPLGDTPVSEPVTLRLLAPTGAAGLRVTTDTRALIAVHGRLPERAHEAVARWAWPYDQVEDQPLRWRYAPRAEPQAFPRRADDHAARVARGQVMLLHAQVRAEPVAPVEAGGSSWRAEHPRGAHARLRVLERVPSDRRAEALGRWGAGSYMRLRRDAHESVDLGPGGPQTAEALFQAAGSGVAVVGQEMTLLVGGQRLRWTVSGRAGHKPLPGRGVTELYWNDGPAEMLVLVDRPPVGRSGAPIYEVRQLHRLGGGGLTLTIDKEGNDAVALNMVLYWLEGAPREATALQIEIDGGNPRRREAAQVSALTPGTRALQVLPARRTEVVMADRRGLSGAGLARVAAVLGDDLAPGRHTVRVTPLSGPPVWLRFFREGQATGQAGALQWNERRDGVTLEDSDDEEE